MLKAGKTNLTRLICWVHEFARLGTIYRTTAHFEKLKILKCYNCFSKVEEINYFGEKYVNDLKYTYMYDLISNNYGDK